MKKILAIETSCDETAVALIQGSGRAKPSIFIRTNVISSQVKIHKKYGGVVPHLAAREHERNLIPVLFKALGLKIPAASRDLAKTDKFSRFSGSGEDRQIPNKSQNQKFKK